ncbi:hypothetical protein Hanom_Chr08g00732421 [Helianthus anomalus]
MVNHHMSHSSTFSLVKFLKVPLRDSLLVTIQRLPNSPLVSSYLPHLLMFCKLQKVNCRRVY